MPPLSPEYSCSYLCDSLNSSLTSLEDVDDTVKEPLHHLHDHDYDSPSSHQEQRGGENQKREHHIRFSGCDHVCETLHKDDMTDLEKQDYWFSYEEIRAIKMDCMGLLGMLEDGMEDMLLFDDDICLRGLEQYAGEGKRQRIATRKQIYKEVFEIQQAMISNYAHNSYIRIAEVSSNGSDALRREARELAKMDALAVGMLA